MNFLMNLQFWPRESSAKRHLKTSSNGSYFRVQGALKTTERNVRSATAICALSCTNMHRFHLLCVRTMVNTVRAAIVPREEAFAVSVCVGHRDKLASTGVRMFLVIAWAFRPLCAGSNDADVLIKQIHSLRHAIQRDGDTRGRHSVHCEMCWLVCTSISPRPATDSGGGAGFGPTFGRRCADSLGNKRDLKR